jgi:hypothetical protein
MSDTPETTADSIENATFLQEKPLKISDSGSNNDKKQGTASRISIIIKSCSVEPILVLNMTAVALVQVKVNCISVKQNFNLLNEQVISKSWLLRLACEELTQERCFSNISLGHNGTDCYDCDQYDNQAELQKIVADVQVRVRL